MGGVGTEVGSYVGRHVGRKAGEPDHDLHTPAACEDDTALTLSLSLSLTMTCTRQQPAKMTQP